jgi:hypothetical protein
MSLVQKRGIAPDAVDESKVKLSNLGAIRARNNAGTADISLMRLNSSDKAEILTPLIVPASTAAGEAAQQGYVDTGLALKINSSLIGVNSGVASLDASGKIPSSQLPATTVGALNYKGTLDASTSAYPSSPVKGDYYVVSVAGTISGHAYAVGDWAAYDGAAWDYIDNSQKVSSINGFVGAVVLSTTNIAEGTNLYYTQARFDTAFAAKSTSNLAEGTNLYFTNARAIAATLTGYTAAAGTVSATDSILSALQKIDGNTGTKQAAFTRAKEAHTATSGEVTAHVINLAHVPLSNSLLLEAFGVVQLEGVDYSLSGSTVTFINGGDLYSQVVAGDILYAQYVY